MTSKFSFLTFTQYDVPVWATCKGIISVLLISTLKWSNVTLIILTPFFKSPIIRENEMLKVQ